MREYFKEASKIPLIQKMLTEGIIYLVAKINLNKFNGLAEFLYREKERRCSTLHAFGVPFELWSTSIAEVLAQCNCTNRLPVDSWILKKKMKKKIIQNVLLRLILKARLSKDFRE